MALLVSCLFNILGAYLLTEISNISFLSNEWCYMIGAMAICNLAGIVNERYWR